MQNMFLLQKKNDDKQAGRDFCFLLYLGTVLHGDCGQCVASVHSPDEGVFGDNLCITPEGVTWVGIHHVQVLPRSDLHYVSGRLDVHQGGHPREVISGFVRRRGQNMCEAYKSFQG
jgi:hypothetical protein